MGSVSDREAQIEEEQMTRLEFSDFYKFLVSLGTVLVALALIMPWLFLRESFDALVSVSDISELTPTAQALIRHRQTAALWFVGNAMWISAGLATAGILLLAFGLFLWWRKQNVLDRRDMLETEKLRQEVESLSPAQIAEKVVKEAGEEARLQEGEAVEEEPQLEEAEKRERRDTYFSMIEEYFRVENGFLSKLLTCFGERHVLTHKRIQGMMYDAVVLPPVKAPDAVFEIKVTRIGPHQMAFHSGLDQLILATPIYTALTERAARGVLLIVLLEGVPERAQVDHYVEVAKRKAETHGVDLSVHLVAEKDLVRLTCGDLKHLIYGTADAVMGG